MIQRLIDPVFFQRLLIAAAFVTPIVAFIVYRARGSAASRRVAIAAGALGPFALAYWQFHNVILARVGFDNIYSALIVMLVAVVIGIAVGTWAGRENRPRAIAPVNADGADPKRRESPPPQR